MRTILVKVHVVAGLLTVFVEVTFNVAHRFCLINVDKYLSMNDLVKRAHDLLRVAVDFLIWILLVIELGHIAV